ncbi:MAG: DsbA family protein [Spirochaetia bacterium]|nr:DsbA family protein [Spirochaetia bacterium]
MKQKTLFIVAAVVLVLVFLIGSQTYNRKKAEESAKSIQSNQAYLVRMHSPVLGKDNAPVVIVEFLDPACETCSEFYPHVKQMLSANPDKIKLVLRYAPFHHGSDKVVAALEAARKQGKFWPALEALLKTQHEWAANHTANVDLIWSHLEGLGLNFQKMRLDMLSPEIISIIEQDLSDARALNVTMTPEYFVNGKPLPSFGYQQLVDLVDEAIASAGH